MAAALENNQFGWIVTDADVSDFLNRVAVPRLATLSDPDQVALLKKVVEEQKKQVDE